MTHRDYPNRVQLMMSEQDTANFVLIAAWLRSLGLPDNQAAVLRYALRQGAIEATLNSLPTNQNRL